MRKIKLSKIVSNVYDGGKFKCKRNKKTMTISDCQECYAKTMHNTMASRALCKQIHKE